VPASNTQFAAAQPADPPVVALSKAALHAPASAAGSQPLAPAPAGGDHAHPAGQADSDAVLGQVVVVGEHVACQVQFGPASFVLPVAAATPVQLACDVCAPAPAHAPVLEHPLPPTAPASKRQFALRQPCSFSPVPVNAAAQLPVLAMGEHPLTPAPASQ
jgi:hypothetical protein